MNKPITDVTEPTPGQENNNWNLRDKLIGIAVEDYSTALRHGFQGSETDWELYYNELVHGTPVEDLSTVLDPPIPDTWPEPEPGPLVVPDITVKRACNKAARAARQYRTGPFIRMVLWLTATFMFLVIAMGGALAWVVTNNTVSQRVENTRPCTLNQEGIELTGTRTYSYIDNTLFGFHWSRNDTLITRTVVNVTMKGLTVVAITKGESKTVRRGEAEGGVMILPDADYYAFFSNGRATGVAYDVLCK
jgi:hypothetical protein